MLFEIKSRHDGSVLFSLECGSMRLCVEAAVRSSADLRSADLRYAKWPKDATVLNPPLQLWGLLWPVTIFGSHMQIGCEVHSVREWEAFGDRRILEMSGQEALEFWRLNKTRLLAFRDVEAEEAFAAKSLQPEPVAAEQAGGA